MARMWADRKLLAGLLLLSLTTGPVAAAPFDHAPYYPLLIAQRDQHDNGGISLDEAVAQARRRHDGKVLSAKTTRVDGRKVHRIKILTPDGRVKRVQVDAGEGKKNRKLKKNKKNNKHKR